MDIQIYNIINQQWLGCQKSQDRVPNRGEFIELDKQEYEVVSIKTIYGAANVPDYTQHEIQVKKVRNI